MRIPAALPLNAALLGLVLALLLAEPAAARPGTRHCRQDLRMLPANATGTPQDQALASGVVLEEAVAASAPGAVPASASASASAANASSATTTATPTAAAATPVPPRLVTPVPSRAADGRRPSMPTVVSMPAVPPAQGQDRTKAHSGLAADFAGEDSNIVFPSPQTKPPLTGIGKFDPFAQAPGRHAPACAKGSTFCTDVENYPENYLQTMLRSATVGLGYRSYFGNDVIAEANITQRIDANDEIPLCPYEESVVYPKVAKNKEDKWLYVVNQDHFVQGVRIETCLSQGTACQLAENFPYGYTTSCRQKYILRKLVALNQEGQTQTDMFRLPSCCSCYVTRSNISNRRSNMTPVVKKTGSRKR